MPLLAEAVRGSVPLQQHRWLKEPAQSGLWGQPVPLTGRMCSLQPLTAGTCPWGCVAALRGVCMALVLMSKPHSLAP